MDAPTLRLSDNDLRRVVEDVDAMQVVAAALIARSGGSTDWAADTTGSFAVDNDSGLAVYESTQDNQRCVMSAAGQRGYRSAVLTALSTRHLLTPGVVTASVVGSGLALDLQLAALCRHVSDISHIAVATIDSPAPDQAVLALLDRHGIGLSLVATPADAVFGANLVVLADPGRLDALRLAKGAVLVNATGVDLPAALLDRVHAIYVDDPTRLAGSARSFAKAQPTRQRGRVHHPHTRPSVVAGLGQVLAGEHPGRIDNDHVLLVELIGGPELDLVVADSICQAALAAGLGTPVRD
jgi:ornithine cyclodeaminase/alanine dehydrogenase-like protein (mu-crystallin family)